MTIGILGLGRLGEALARGLTRGGAAEPVLGFNRTAEKARAVAQRAPGLELAGSAREVLERCDPVFLWMKRDDAAALLDEHHTLVAQRQPLVVSSTLGVPLATHTGRWAESIPNVNLSTGRGVTLVAFPSGAAAEDRALLRKVLAPTGAVHELPAGDLAYLTVLASCGPALYARMLQLFADALSARRGYDRELCRAMVRETMAGTLALQEQDGVGADEVVWRVAHPGGLTEKGLTVLERRLPALFEEMLTNMGRW